MRLDQAVQIRDKLRQHGLQAGVLDESDEGVGMYHHWSVYLNLDGYMVNLEPIGLYPLVDVPDWIFTSNDPYGQESD